MSINSISTSMPAHLPLQKEPIEKVEDDFEKFKYRLYQHYDGQIVDDLFSKIKTPTGWKFSAYDGDRFELYCFFLDNKKKLLKKYEGSDKPFWRLLNHLLKQIHFEFHKKVTLELEVKKEMRSSQRILSHQDIQQSIDNFFILSDFLKNTLKEYGEDISHRIIKRADFFSTSELLGLQSLKSIEELKSLLKSSFSEELQLRKIIESSTFEELSEGALSLKARIDVLEDKNTVRELTKELAQKTGRTEWLKPALSSNHIKKQADLFRASTEGSVWADKQKELSPHTESTHDIFFLKTSSQNEEKDVAVFKHSSASGAMEALVYDLAMIFGLDDGFVPTKLKKLKDKVGSVQIFQKGLLGSNFLALPIQKQMEIYEKISMEGFLKGAIPALLFANQDLHCDNFFIVEEEDGSYSIKLFDNEFTLNYSNYAILSVENECWLPFRCSLLIFPHADYLITGEVKHKIREKLMTWAEKYSQFIKYLSSAAAREKFNLIGASQQISNLQVEAFHQRIVKFIECINSQRDFTFRDLVIKIFPFYYHFFGLEKIFFPHHTEVLVGTHSAEYLHNKIIEAGCSPEVEQQLNKILKQIQKHAKLEI